MATTRSRKKSTRSSSRSSSSSSSSSSRKRNTSLPARTARTVRDRPYASAAIAGGTLAAALGAFFLARKSSTLRSTAQDMGGLVKDGIADMKARMDGWRHRDSSASADDHSQREIAEEAMTLKATGKKARKPADPVVEQQTKAGAVAY